MEGSLIAALEAKITVIQSTLTEAEETGWKWNEAQTESVIIDPLLAVLGYGPLEAHKQGHDAVTKDIPDYTLLPTGPHRWFLEVKKLGLTLKDGEAHQAVSYAVAQGAEWAVLTNGRAWYFYNAHYPKPLAEKRAFQIDDLFSEPDAASRLALLSRQSMMNKGLTQAWATVRATEIVRQQLQTPNSATRKALRKAVSEELQTSVADSLVGSLLDRALLVAADFILPPELAPSASEPVAENATPMPLVFIPDVSEPDDLFTLDYLEQHPDLVTGQRPAVVKLLGSPPQPIKSWSELVQKAVIAVAAQYGLPPLPFVGSLLGEKYFLNTSPVRVDSKPMITVVQISVNGTLLYADMNRSAINTVQGLVLLLKSVGAHPSAVRLKTAPSKSISE